MIGFLRPILELFGFTELQTLLAVVSLVFFLSCLLGGLISGLTTAYGKPGPDRKLTDRMSFRMITLGEILVILFILYYHGAVITNVEPAHLIYWGSSLVIGPVLGMLGSQVTELVFHRRIGQNKKIYKKYLAMKREKEFARRAKEFEKSNAKNQAAEEKRANMKRAAEARNDAAQMARERRRLKQA